MLENTAFLVALTLFSFRFCDTTSSDCTQLTPCSCILSNGLGYNLSNLAKEGILESSGTEKCNYTFYFQPCQNAIISRKEHKCDGDRGVSVCAWNPNTSSFLVLGTVEETSLILLPNGSLTLRIEHTNSSTDINLSCCVDCSTKFTVDACPSINHYTLTLMTPEACKTRLGSRELSLGSILVILFFVFSGIYFVAGASTLKLLRGATGWEMLPHHEFWSELPSLVRDGIVFAFGCCRANSYERI